MELTFKHVPKDSNPDLLVWNQQCSHYTRDASILFRIDSPLRDLNASLVAQHPITIRGRLTSSLSGSRGTRTHNGLTRNCFQDSALIQPVDFHQW